jgi:hypothetical protein
MNGAVMKEAVIKGIGINGIALNRSCKMSISKKLVTVVVALMLAGCGSTSNTASVPTINNVNSMETAKTAYQVNKVIEKITEQEDCKGAWGCWMLICISTKPAKLSLISKNRCFNTAPSR